MINNKSFVLISTLLLQSLCIASVDETTFIDNICNMTPLPENCTSLLMLDPSPHTKRPHNNRTRHDNKRRISSV